MVGQRAIVHQTLIRPGRKRMRAQRGDGRFRRHPCVANTMGAGQFGYIKPLGHVARQAHFLVNLDGLARAHHPCVRAHLFQRRAGLGHLVLGQVDHRVGVFHAHRDMLIDRRGQIPLQMLKHNVGVRGLNGQLGATFGVIAVNRNARTVRPAIRHGDQHLGQHFAQLGLKRFIFQK